MRITERRLRKIIRSVIRESMAPGAMSRDLDSAVEACKVGDLNSMDYDHNDSNQVIEDKIMSYIEEHHIDDLDRVTHKHSGAGTVKDQQFTPGTDSYNQEVLSHSRRQDYDNVIINMPELHYQKMVSSCQTHV
tara:strand:- start:955 stop:1353 length:399 start_codon:yes stop_codon:yes gene_type:complete